MITRQQALDLCTCLPGTYADAPFHDPNWTVVRHQKNRKVFAWIFQRQGQIWINLKAETQWLHFWRQTYPSVIPAYHLNKDHWNSVILDGSVPREDLLQMIRDSYRLTGSRSSR